MKQEIEELKLAREQLFSKNENLKAQLIEKEGYDKSVVEILQNKHETRGEFFFNNRFTFFASIDILGDIELNTNLERELWRELSIARCQLEKANEKLEMYATEKARFIETMRRNVSVTSQSFFISYCLLNAQEGEGDPLKQLMEKENEISNLRIQNKQLQSANDSK